MFRLVGATGMAAAVIQIAACGGDSRSSLVEDPAGAVEDIADIKADVEGLESALEDLRGQLEDLALQTAALERDREDTPDTGDDWRAVRDAASPQLQLAVELYAACRAGEWSHPGGDPVIQDSGLDAAGLAIAAGLEEAVWRDIATGRMANSQADVVRLIDRTHPWPHCALEDLYSE